MSQAFVKEGDAQWLHDVQPTMNALIAYLSNENNGIRIYEKRSRIDEKTSEEIHEMSNGLEYRLDKDRKWEIVE